MATGGTSTSSVSKGCFVIRPQKASSSRKRKSEVKNEGFPRGPGESDAHCRARYEIYKETWNTVEELVNSLHTNLNDNVFANLLEFINKSVSSNKVPYLLSQLALFRLALLVYVTMCND